MLTLLRRLLFPRGLYCALCNKEYFSDDPYLCPECEETSSWAVHCRPLDGLTSVQVAGHFESLQRECIHRFKYGNHRYLAEYLAAQMITLDAPNDALLIPVPCHPRRKRQRGFSQTRELARAITQQTRRPLDVRALKRIRNTPSQTTLGAKERFRNVTGAFSADKKRVQGRHCLLIEDVVTTGATLQACAQALRNSGARSVSAWVLAGGDDIGFDAKNGQIASTNF